MTIEELDKNNIKYELVLQSPQDLLMVMPGSYHMGINLGPNLAEAKNFLSQVYQNEYRMEFIPCSCGAQTTIPESIVQSAFLPKFNCLNSLSFENINNDQLEIGTVNYNVYLVDDDNFGFEQIPFDDARN